MKYGIIFLGNSSNSKMIFTLEKKTVRIVAGNKPRNSCSSLFKRLKTLSHPHGYIFSLMNFAVNKNIFKQIQLYALSIHGIRTTSIDQLLDLNAFKKVLIILTSKYSTVYNLVSKVL
jgi:hypothetical protein